MFKPHGGHAQRAEPSTATRPALFGCLHGILDPEAIKFGDQIPPALAEMLIARVRFPTRSRYDAGLPLPRLLASRATGEPATTGAALKALKTQFFL